MAVKRMLIFDENEILSILNIRQNHNLYRQKTQTKGKSMASLYLSPLQCIIEQPQIHHR